MQKVDAAIRLFEKIDIMTTKRDYYIHLKRSSGTEKSSLMNCLATTKNFKPLKVLRRPLKKSATAYVYLLVWLNISYIW